jgi:tyrosine-specific transport protein
MLGYVLRTTVSHTAGVIACMLFIAAVAYAGAKSADAVNRFMVAAMVVSYFMLVGVAVPHIQANNLLYTNWSAMFGVVPILLLCFGYQNLVPSLSYYLEKNARAIRTSIVIGNFIPFIVYFIWDFVILGMLPGHPVKTGDDTQLVAGLLTNAANPSISVIFFIKSFSLFAMLTSFLPCALSFVDFLKDGISKLLHQKVRNDFFIFLLVFIPPTVCALIYPSIFLHALGFAGGFIDVLLFGVLPALVVLIGRKMQPPGARYQVAGGALTPIMILLLSSALLVMKYTLT